MRRENSAIIVAITFLEVPTVVISLRQGRLKVTDEDEVSTLQ